MDGVGAGQDLHGTVSLRSLLARLAARSRRQVGQPGQPEQQTISEQADLPTPEHEEDGVPPRPVHEDQGDSPGLNTPSLKAHSTPSSAFDDGYGSCNSSPHGSGKCVLLKMLRAEASTLLLEAVLQEGEMQNFNSVA